MKVTQVLEKVSELERLQMAWQQVKKNAGAAGIDRYIAPAISAFTPSMAITR